MSLKAVKLDAARYGAGSRIYKAQSVGRFTRDNFGAMEPGKLVSIMQTARDGDLEDFADLCSYAVRTDPTLRSLVITRLNAVAGADIEVLPGPHGPGEEGVAEAAAEFVRGALERVEEWEDRFTDLLWGTFLNVGVLENHWKPQRDSVWGDFRPVLTRDLRYWGDYNLHVRTFLDESGQPSNTPRWVSLRDEPHKFTVNTPRNISERPTLTGEMYAVLWPWMFKRWVEKFGLEGFGKLANGLLVMTVPENTDDNVIDKRLEDLENLATDGAVVVKAPANLPGNPIELLEASRDPGATQKTLLDYYNAEMAKAILGSGLNVEVGSTGGNRALGESQFATTILPRLQADAKRALGAVRRDWVKPLLSFNRHKFGGRMPPVPYLSAIIAAEEKPDAPTLTLAVQNGVVKKDELRQAAGLDPAGPEMGGDEFVSPLAKVQPSFGQASGGAPPPAPFRRSRPKKPHQLRLPLERTATPTPSASPTPLSIALSTPSDDPER